MASLASDLRIPAAVLPRAAIESPRMNHPEQLPAQKRESDVLRESPPQIALDRASAWDVDDAAESTPEVASVLGEYELAGGAGRCRRVGAGSGFSGASVWRVATAAGEFALRRSPAGQPPPPRRAWLHRFLRFVQARGLDFIAAPVNTRYGATFVERGGHSWELAPWLPGAADFHRDPSRERLAAAMTALARFHGAAASFPGASLAGTGDAKVWMPNRAGAKTPPTIAPSPGLADRIQLLERLMGGETDEMRQRVARSLASIGQGNVNEADKPGAAAVAMAPRAARLLELFDPVATAALERLRQHAATPVPLQPCLRDVWHNHVLFTGNKVSGLIDYDAIRIDSVAGDLARLLGSLLEDDWPSWEFALAAYSQIRPLSERETGLIDVFDLSSLAISGTQWVRWLYLDQLEFPAIQAVAERMDHWIRRSERFFARGAVTRGHAVRL
ncbi:MAG: hypothetical protein RLY70_3444 [Planctomycetota bacterium]